MGVKGWIHSVETFGTLDGPGVRYVLFMQGCSLRCLYCHNPDTWDVNVGDSLGTEARGGFGCGSGGCSSYSGSLSSGGSSEGTTVRAGKEADSEAIVKDILSYKNYIRTGGITLSGGEPLLQPEFALDIIQRCKEHGIHSALDTAGSVPLSLSKPVLDEIDLVLLDIKSLDDAQCVQLTGKSNINTRATLDYCEKIGKPVWLRHVLVPGLTLDMSRIADLADYLKPYQCIQTVELLPFHKMGEYKWKELNLEYRLGDTREPTYDELQQVRKIFEEREIPCLMKEN